MTTNTKIFELDKQEVLMSVITGEPVEVSSLDVLVANNLLSNIFMFCSRNAEDSLDHRYITIKFIVKYGKYIIKDPDQPFAKIFDSQKDIYYATPFSNFKNLEIKNYYLTSVKKMR